MWNGRLRTDSNRCCDRFFAVVSILVSRLARRPAANIAVTAVAAIANTIIAARTSTRVKPPSPPRASRRATQLPLRIGDTGGQPFDVDRVGLRRAGPRHRQRALAGRALLVEVHARA